MDAPVVSPCCRVELDPGEDGARCRACARWFVEASGILDLRLAPDPWIDMDADRRKGARVLAETPGGTFRDTVEHYWRLTPDTPAARAARFVDRVVDAEARSAEWLQQRRALLREGARVLDLGCGTGDATVVLADLDMNATGVDVAFRWLVQARRRLGGKGSRARFICANAEHLPFPDASFDVITSLHLLEHCTALEPVLSEAARVLRHGGQFVGRTMNRFAPVAEPHVGVWGVGWVPRAWANSYVQWRIGEPYRFHRLPSTMELRRAFKHAGLVGTVNSAPLLKTEADRLTGITRLAAGVFDRGRHLPVVGQCLDLIAPLLEFDVTRP